MVGQNQAALGVHDHARSGGLGRLLLGLLLLPGAAAEEALEERIALEG